jgi:hypothetical protein
MIRFSKKCPVKEPQDYTVYTPLGQTGNKIFQGVARIA